jgi:hypothetical protein
MTMSGRYESDGVESLLPWLLLGVAVIIGKVLAVLGILTKKNSTTLAKITGVLVGGTYGAYMASCCTVKGPPWLMFLAGGTLVGVISFAVAFLGYALMAKDDKSE